MPLIVYVFGCGPAQAEGNDNGSLVDMSPSVVAALNACPANNITVCFGGGGGGGLYVPSANCAFGAGFGLSMAITVSGGGIKGEEYVPCIGHLYVHVNLTEFVCCSVCIGGRSLVRVTRSCAMAHPTPTPTITNRTCTFKSQTNAPHCVDTAITTVATALVSPSPLLPWPNVRILCICCCVYPLGYKAGMLAAGFTWADTFTCASS